ncbi:MAG: PD40 domain-containing protein [Sandaracinus sp.]|nr:PD40 domain-containing protein [Sandaracinus sp.]MCB9636360.1 PD40 domain-containing protein [Sandaracinus sp.]
MASFVAVLAGGVAKADTPGALVPRRAITAGGHDHYRAQLAHDGRDVYFLGNESRTPEIFVQNLERGFPRLLFDDAAEVGQPRLSPNGRRLLYVSYRRDAGGDACVFDLEDEERTCVTREGVAVSHVFWFPDGRVGALTQPSYGAPHEVRRFRVRDGEANGRLLLRRHLATPEVSPDGGWLVFVPLEQRTEGARGSLHRSAPGLRLRALEGDRELAYDPALPGTTTAPVFARDGRYLYFVQHPNDSNFDGTIDEDDRGVLYRVPFDPASPQPLKPGTEEQLTSHGMDCQHPAPAHDRLLATCVRGEYLQIDSMPLEGLFPREWDVAKIRAERAATRDPAEDVGLWARELASTNEAATRVEILRQLVMRHLRLREYESADHYARALVAETVDETSVRDWVKVIRELIAHRQTEQRLPLGNLDAQFVAHERERSARLAGYFESPDATVARLARLVDAELVLVLGDATEALVRFDEVSIEDERDATVVQLWGEVADALLSIAGERRRWRRVHGTLATHAALSSRDRLHHARLFVDVTVRGRRVERAREQLAEAREGLDPQHPLALMIDVGLAWVSADEGSRAEGADAAALEREMQAAVDAVWSRAADLEARRVIAMTAVERAAHRDWTELARHVAGTWRDELPFDHPERKYAEVLYEEVMLERAYVELDRGRSPRALFRQLADDTKSLEAHLGYFEAALREGTSIADLRAECRTRFAPESPLARFAEAYLAARELDAISDPEAYLVENDRLEALLHPVAEDWPRAAEVHHLFAFLAHRRYHRTGESDARRAAHARYYLALDLAPHAPRRRAALLEQVGQLQSELGNHRIALGHFEERERLPFRTPTSELSFRLSKARSLFHVGAYERARTELLRGRELMEAHPELATYRPLVLDRAALYSLASGEEERALRLYGRLVEVTDDSSFPPAVRLKARLGRAAAAVAVGEHAQALEELERIRPMLDDTTPFRDESARAHRRAESHFEREDYRPLVLGLLAVARRGVGELEGAYEALVARAAFYEARLDDQDRDADLLELARIAHQLAENAYRRGELAVARRHVEEGLRKADEYVERTESELDETTVALVRAAAELRVYGGLRGREFDFDVRERLRQVHAQIAQVTDGRFAAERFLFPVYLAALEVPRR